MREEEMKTFSFHSGLYNNQNLLFQKKPTPVTTALTCSYQATVLSGTVKYYLLLYDRILF